MQVYVHHHLGLGDHIICNGLVRNFINILDDPSRLILATKRHNMSSVGKLYNDTSIILDPVEGDSEAVANYKDNLVLRVGFERSHPVMWEMSFYSQFGLEYSKRFTDFYIDRDLESENRLLEMLNLPEKFAFCNTRASTGSYPISVDTDLPIVQIEPLTDSLFDWIPVINKAAEIYTIDSSVFQLVKQLTINKKCRKVFYDTRRMDPTRVSYTFEDESWERYML